MQHVSYFLHENDLYVHGGIYTEEGYKDLDGYHLFVKGDVLDQEGRILYTLRDWSGKYHLALSGYDSFELSSSLIQRFMDVKAIAEIKLSGAIVTNS